MTCSLIFHIYIDNQHKELDLSKINQQIITLGRSENNDIIINSPEIIGNQLIFEFNDQGCFIGDLSGQGILSKGRLIKEKRLEHHDVLMIGQGKKVTILVTDQGQQENIFHHIALDKTPLIKIGNGIENHIIYQNSLVSKVHALIIREPSGDLIIQDLDSRNGVFINDYRINHARLNLGDVINIVGYKIIYSRDFLAISDVGREVEINNLEPYIFEEKTIIVPIRQETPKEIKPQRTKAPYPYFQKSPRFIPDVPSGDIEISSPPYRAVKPEISWLAVLLPSVSMLITTLVMFLVTKGGAYMLITLGMTAVSIYISIQSYQSQLKKYHHTEAKRKEAYLAYLDGIKEELENKRHQHQKALQEIHPDFSICIQRVEELKRELWERTSDDEDFLTVRLGKGRDALKGKIKVPKKEISIDEDSLLQEPQKLLDTYSYVDDVPICVSLIKAGTLGIVGKAKKMQELARNIAVQIAAAHSYDEVKIICIYPEKEAPEWEWIRWLPHTWDEQRELRFIAKEKKSAHEILTYLYDLIKIRDNHQEQKVKQRDNRQLPYLVFFLADRELLHNEPMMNYLTRNNHNLGISSLFFFSGIEHLPKDCQVIIDISSEEGQIYQRQSLSNRRLFSLDYISLEDAEKFARKTAPIRLKNIAGSTSIPKEITFLDTFHVKRIKDLNILERWQINKAYRSLAVPLGEKAGQDNFILDIHEKFHGPHGLVAGTTGSGKSELLQTLILALGVNFHPHDVNFILIDYKGGGMANAFLGLPHLVGRITNLGGNETTRALLSIKSEILKRQSILSKYGLNNIDQYIPLYKDKRVEVPLPHLIIIADEFAELKAEQPDFMKELVSAARVGRSLGIHLILATQKPSGVVDDQIWSNSRFKLCLKVQDAADSQEVIKRPDAAQINIAGRGFIQVGNDEVFDEFQSGWSGAPYQKDKESSGIHKLKFINLDGSRKEAMTKYSSIAPSENSTYSEDISQLKGVVEYIAEIVKTEGICLLQGPWLPPLPERVFLEDIIQQYVGSWNGDKWVNSQAGLCPVIGLMDNPAEQQQDPLTIDLGKEGHIAIYGVPGSGKTNLIQTLITSLALRNSPDEVNFYIIDFGSRSMGVFSQLPHLGGIVFPEEKEKLSKLCKLLSKELNDRKISFSELGVNNRASYIKAAGRDIPALLLAVDNYSAFSEMYPELEENLVTIAREGGNYGIHLILTANSTNGIRYRVSQNIRMAIALQMADKGDYISIVGRTEGLTPDNHPGRGLIKLKKPLEIQIAMPLIAENQYDMSIRMKGLFKEMADKWQGRRAKTIPVMPEVLTFTDIINNDEVKEVCNNQPLFIPLGLEMEDLRPIGFDLFENHCFLISGYGNNFRDNRSTNLLINILALFNHLFADIHSEVYIIDNPAGELAETAETYKVKGYINNNTVLTALIDELVNELNIRKRDLNQIKGAAPRGFNEEKYIIEKYHVKVLLINNLMDFIEMIEDESKDNFERIVRFGKGLGVFIFITGQGGDINKLSQIDTLTKGLVDQRSGVIIEGTPEEHGYYQFDIPYQERNKSLQQGEGYFVIGGSYIKTKIVTK